MFCPVCKAEYRLGFTHCSDCDADLVESLGNGPGARMESRASEAGLDAPELLWSGIDSGTFARITAALGEAGISFHDEAPGARLLYASLRHPLEVWIQKGDRDAARRILAEILGEAASESEPATTDAVASVEPADRSLRGLHGRVSRPAGGEAERGELEAPSDDAPAPDDTLEGLDPEEATVEVWSGEEGAMAQFLKDCLRENGIGSLIDAAETTRPRLLVHPGSEARAREIVRDVREGAPPS